MKKIWMNQSPMINLHRYDEVNFMGSTLGLRGRYTVELVHAKTGLIARHLEFDNLIPNAGMDALTTNNALVLFNYCAVGSGTNVPAFTDITLQTELARTSSTGGFDYVNATNLTNGYSSLTQTRVFTTAQANGNISEVGMFTSFTGGVLMSRQRIKDENGVDTTITKTSDYELRVVYEIRVYWPVGDVITSALINGVAQNVTARVAYLNLKWAVSSMNIGSFATTNGHWVSSAGLSVNTSAPTPYNNERNSDTSIATYIAGSYQRDVTITWSPILANTAIKTFVINLVSDTTQHQLTNVINKNNTQQLVLNYRKTWARV